MAELRTTALSSQAAPSPAARFWATIGAQVGGFFLLFALAIVFLLTHAPNEQEGQVEFTAGTRSILWALVLYVVASLVATAPSVIQIIKSGKTVSQIEHAPVDRLIYFYLSIDIFILTVLVCQQGGLCTSPFLPVFFLIPTAYFAVERDENLMAKVTVVSSIIAAILIGYITSILTQPPLPSDPDGSPFQS